MFVLVQLPFEHEEGEEEKYINIPDNKKHISSVH